MNFSPCHQSSWISGWRHRSLQVMLQNGIVVFLLTPKQRLQRLDVTNGVSQNLHFGQPLVGVGGCASLEVSKASLTLLSLSSPSWWGFAAVSVGGFSLAGFACPQQAPAGLMMPAGRPHVLVLDWVMLVGLEQAHVDEPGVQVFKEVHVICVEARVVVEIISRRDGEGISDNSIFMC